MVRSACPASDLSARFDATQWHAASISQLPLPIVLLFPQAQRPELLTEDSDGERNGAGRDDGESAGCRNNSNKSLTWSKLVQGVAPASAGAQDSGSGNGGGFCFGFNVQE